MGHSRPIRNAAALALAFASLTGCGLNDKQRDEVEDIASDVASDQITDSEEISELEARVAELETRLPD